MSFMDAYKGAQPPKLQLSRKGLVAVSSAVTFVLVALLASWEIKTYTREIADLRAAIRTKEEKALAALSIDPKARQIAELEKQVLAFQRNEHRLMEISDAITQSAAAMPEFRSTQYKEPYQVLLKQINELNLATRNTPNEAAQ